MPVEQPPEPDVQLAPLPPTNVFVSPTSTRKSPLFPREMFEDLYDCLRLAVITASSQYDKEKEASRWFASILETLPALGFTLFEQSTGTLSYTPSSEVLDDVFIGWLAPPQAANTRFKSISTDIRKALKSPHLAIPQKMSSSTHLCVDLDSDDGVTPVAILFHMHCTNDPLAPRSKMNLAYVHLGAQFNKDVFTQHRARVQSQLLRFGQNSATDLTAL